eukprot:1072573-Prorocentrum_minimum.AAC.1
MLVSRGIICILVGIICVYLLYTCVYTYRVGDGGALPERGTELCGGAHEAHGDVAARVLEEVLADVAPPSLERLAQRVQAEEAEPSDLLKHLFVPQPHRQRRHLRG